MNETLQAERDGRRLELVLPPARGEGAPLALAGVRQALAHALQAPPPETGFVLIRGAAPGGFAGPEMASGPQAREASVAPTISDLCEMVASAPVPVAVLLEGPVSGQGAEFALAASCRLADPAAGFDLGAMALGRLPGGGASLRLPRLIGAQEALRLMLKPEAISAAEALALGLYDQVFDDEAPEARLAAARAAAAALNNAGRAAPGLRDARGYLGAVAAARTALGPAPLAAAEAAVDCVEAALLLPEGQARAFAALREAEVAAAPEAAALAHLLRAERRNADLPPALAGFAAATPRRLGLAGADVSLAPLTLAALSRGLSVTVSDLSRERLAGFLQAVAARQEAAVQAGRLTPAQRDADWARLTPAQEEMALEASGLILAAPGGALPPPLRGRAVMMTGRGALAPGAFRLVLAGRLAELALPPSSPGPVVVTARAFLMRLGYRVVLTGQQASAGISGRLAAAGGTALRAMAEMGVASAVLTAALSAAGLPAPQVPVIGGVARREMGAEEIIQRWLAALANEGARLLQAGVTQNIADIDLVAVAGLGFPRRLGGPMHQADRRGLLILRRDLAQWAGDHAVWAPVAGLDALASLGRGFAGANPTG